MLMKTPFVSFLRTRLGVAQNSLNQGLFAILFLTVCFSTAWAAKSGQIDTGFSSRVFHDDLPLNRMTLQPDGKLQVVSNLDIIGGTVQPNKIFRLNQDGTLDPSFRFNWPSLSVTDLTVTPEGKIYIIGGFTRIGTTTINNVARLNPDGTLDQTFLSGFASFDSLRAFTLQADGKLIVVGNFSSVGGVARKNIVRLNSDGSVDQTFHPGTGPNQILTSVGIQPDGKIVTGGDFSSFQGTAVSKIARLNPDGTLDQSYQVGSGPNNTSGLKYAFQSDGKIVVTGLFSTFNGLNRSGIVRLNQGGSLDTGFAIPFTTATSVSQSRILPDGKIFLVGGFTSAFGQSALYYLRLNPDGTRDTSFTVRGANDQCLALEVDSQGNYLIGGLFKTVGGIQRRKLARIGNSGTLEAAYNPNLRTAGTSIRTVAVQTNDKVLIAGNFTTIGETSRRGLARLNSDGTLDTLFNPGTGPDTTINAIAVQADGKYLVGGGFNSFSGYSRSKFIRLNSNGSVDFSFSTGTGFAATGLSLPVSVNSIAIQPDGKIVVVGTFTSYSGNQARGIVRLNSNGSFDSTFQSGTGFGNGPSFAGQSVVVDSNGSILVGGDFQVYNGTPVKGILRLDSTGMLDTGFQANIGTGSDNSLVMSLALDDQGRILVAGPFQTFNQQPRKGVVRLNPDGTLDAGFNHGTIFPLVVFQVLPLANQKIAIYGEFIQVGTSPRNRIAILNQDGSADPGFNPGNGIDWANQATALGEQTSGKLIFGATFNAYNNRGTTPLVRLFSKSTSSTAGTFRSDTATFSLRNANSTGAPDVEFVFGNPGDMALAGDWNGDGMDTIGVFRDGQFSLRNSNSAGTPDLRFSFGQAGDLPIAGDWDGDGVDSVGVVRGNTVLLRNSNSQGPADIQFTIFSWPGDTPVAGDWNGDGIDTLGYYNSSNGGFFLQNTNAASGVDFQVYVGINGDQPVVGDWDADGKDWVGVRRLDEWLLRNSISSPSPELAFQFGEPNSFPIAGDWDGQ